MYITAYNYRYNVHYLPHAQPTLWQNKHARKEANRSVTDRGLH